MPRPCSGRAGSRTAPARCPRGGAWLPLLDPHGPPRTIPTLPVWNLLESRSYRALLDSGRLRDQRVLVGPTAPLFQDLHRGPFAGAEGMPGVELHATELANRLEGRALWLWRPGVGVSALGRYLSPAVAAEIAAQPSQADGLLGGRSMEVVVMITDIRGFTAHTRSMSAAGRAAELVRQLNTYLAEVVEAVHREGGTMDKIVGKAALVVFGAPLNRGPGLEAAAALRTARDLQRRLEALNSRWQAKGVEPWQQVIVLNFGAVISGNVGSSSRMEYTVIGDAVNVTSRLEAVAKSCNRPLVMSAAFAALLPAEEAVESLGRYDLRGFGETDVYGLANPDPGAQPGHTQG